MSNPNSKLGGADKMQKSTKTANLEQFESPGSHVAEFQTDELTAWCPFDFGGPDFYTLVIRYEPDKYVVESKSLKEYLQSFRETEISAEQLATDIHTEITETIEPKTCYVELQQARRGGIEETIYVGTDPKSN